MTHSLERKKYSQQRIAQTWQYSLHFLKGMVFSLSAIIVGSIIGYAILLLIQRFSS